MSISYREMMLELLLGEAPATATKPATPKPIVPKPEGPINPADKRTADPKLTDGRFKSQIDAERLGLVHVSHGFYADSTGKIVARSVKDGDDRVLVKVKTHKDPDKDLDGFAQEEDDTELPNKVMKNKEWYQHLANAASDPQTAANTIEQLVRHQIERGTPKDGKIVGSFVEKEHRRNRTTGAFMYKNGEPVFDEKEFKLFQAAGLPAGFATTTDGSPTPTHMVSGGTIIPLKYDNKKGVKYDLTDMAKQVGEKIETEMAADSASAPRKQITRAMVVDAVNDTAMDYIDADRGVLASRKNLAQGWTSEKAMKVQEFSTELQEFLKKPDRERALDLITRYDLSTNATGREFIVGSFAALNTVKDERGKATETIDKIFNSTKRIDGDGPFLKDKIIAAFDEALGEGGFQDEASSSTGMGSYVAPGKVFKELATSLQTSWNSTDDDDFLYVNGRPMPYFIKGHDSDEDVVQKLTEAVRIEEMMHNRQLQKLLGNDHTPEQWLAIKNANPIPPELVQEGKEIGKRVLLYRKRLDKIEEFSKSREKFATIKGRQDLADTVSRVHLSIEKAATKCKVQLTAQDKAVIDIVKSFAVIPNDATPEQIAADYEEKVKALYHGLAMCQPGMRDCSASLGEHLTLFDHLRQNRMAMIPMNTSFPVIDGIFLDDMNAKNLSSVHDLLDIHDSVGLVHADIERFAEVTSVKTATAKYDEKTKRVMFSGTGAPPALGGVIRYHEFDKKIDPQYLELLKSNFNVEQYSEMLPRIAADPRALDTIGRYFGASAPTWVAIEKAIMADLGEKTTEVAKASKRSADNTAYQVCMWGKIGEAFVNSAHTHQLCTNAHVSGEGVTRSNALDKLMAFRFQYDAANPTKMGVSIAATGTKEQLLSVHTIPTKGNVKKQSVAAKAPVKKK